MNEMAVQTMIEPDGPLVDIPSRVDSLARTAFRKGATKGKYTLKLTNSETLEAFFLESWKLSTQGYIS